MNLVSREVVKKKKMNDILVSNNSLLNSELQEDDVSLNCKFIICDFLKNGNNVMLNRKTIDTN